MMNTRTAKNRMRSKSAFTLLEMLAAVTVLVVVLYVVVQITNNVTKVVQSTRRMDADSEARLVFGRLALDFAGMLKRSELDYSSFKQPAGMLPEKYASAGIPANPQPGNDQLAFYAETSGYFSGNNPQKSPVSLVAWRVKNDAILNTPVLQRLSKGLGWESSGNAWKSIVYLPSKLTDAGQWLGLFNTAGYDNDFKPIGSQVFRFEYNYLLKPSGTSAARLSTAPYNSALCDITVSGSAARRSADGFRDVAAIVVTIGVLDHTSRKIVAEANFPRLIEKFDDARDGEALASDWFAKLQEPSFSSDTGIPPPASSRVRIYERYFYLNIGARANEQDVAR